MSTPAPATTRANRPARGSELELTVDRLAYGGNGVARREDGYVVFVAGAVPGDRVRAVVGKAKRAYAEARELLLAAAELVREYEDWRRSYLLYWLAVVDLREGILPRAFETCQESTRLAYGILNYFEIANSLGLMAVIRARQGRRRPGSTRPRPPPRCRPGASIWKRSSALWSPRR